MDAGVTISLVAAITKDTHIIGTEGKLPWHLSDDLKHFKKLTVGKTVMLGRKTQDSIIARLGHSLPERRTIVLTRDINYQCKDCERATSWTEAMDLVKNDRKIFVIGGSEIYKLALPYASKMYLTLVDGNITGDTYFPEFDAKAWDWKLEKEHPKDEKNEYNFSWWTLTKKKSYE